MTTPITPEKRPRNAPEVVLVAYGVAEGLRAALTIVRNNPQNAEASISALLTIAEASASLAKQKAEQVTQEKRGGEC